MFIDPKRHALTKIGLLNTISMYLTDARIFIATFFLSQAARLLPYICAARFFGTEAAGLWSLLLVLLNFLKLSQLGVTNAMNRDLPIFLGAGKADLAGKMVYNAFRWNLFTLFISAILLITVSQVLIFDNAFKELFCFAAVLGPIIGMSQFYEMKAKGYGKFRILSESQLIFSLVSIPLSGLAIYLKKPSGLFISYGICYLIYTFYLRFKLRHLNLESNLWDWSEVRRLLNVGLPMLGVSLGGLLLIGADKFIIAGYMSKAELGFYSISIFTTNGLLLFPLAVGQLTYSKIGYDYGFYRKSNRLLRIIVKDMIPPLFVNTAIYIMVLLWGKPLLGILFPALSGGANLLNILVLSSVIYSVLPGFGNLLLVLGRQWIYFMIQVISISINFLLIYITIKNDWGITGIAWSNTSAVTVQTLFTVGLALLLVNRLSTEKTL